MEIQTEGGSQAASPTAQGEGFSAAAFEAANAGGSPPPADVPDGGDIEAAPAEGDQAPEAPDESAEPAQKTEAEKTDEDAQVPQKTAKRMETLLRERAQAREALHKQKTEWAQSEARYKVALSKLVGDLTSLKAKLGQYEDLESPEYRLEEMQSRQKVQADLQAEQRRLQEQASKEQEKVLVEDARSQLVEAMDDALSPYTHLTRAQLQARFREYAAQHPDVSFEQAPDVFRKLAADLDADLERQYEQRVLEKHKAKLNAPPPVTSTKTIRARGKISHDEFVRQMETDLGPGAFD